jgi:GT2 family glycosyltransferase
LTGPDETSVWRGLRVPEAPVVSVCIPVVSDHGLIEGCLDSLVSSRPSVETEVVVVANGLTESGFSQLRMRDDIVLVRCAVNAGFSGGNNVGARFARGRYLLFLNDDSVVEAGFIDRLLSAVERDPLIAAAGGRILWPDGRLQEAGSVLWGDGWTAQVGSGLPANSTAYQYVRDADFISANGLLVDRHAWDGVGGFDERYFPAYCEDVDLCLALWDHGYRVVYEPRARVRHFESQSTSTPFRNFLLQRNRTQLVAKWATLLQSLARHPDPIDDAAIDAAVLRAERSKGRVLIVEHSADATQWHGVLAVEGLATSGWSVMVSVPAHPRPTVSADRALKDRMIDLGVDVREEPPEDLIARYADGLEAVVVSGPDTDPGFALERPDGNSIPLVIARHDRDDSVVARVTAVVRRGVVSSVSAGVHTPARAVADLHLSHQAPGRLEGGGEVVPGSPEAATNDDDATRDAKFAEQYVRIRREYCEFLECELARNRAEFDTAFGELVEAFDEKERYIDSLPSVRVKKWIVGLLPNRES